MMNNVTNTTYLKKDIDELVHFYDKVVREETKSNGITDLDTVQIEFSSKYEYEEWGKKTYSCDKLKQYLERLEEYEEYEEYWDAEVSAITNLLEKLIRSIENNIEGYEDRNRDWYWREECQFDFSKIKDILINHIEKYLSQYDEVIKYHDEPIPDAIKKIIDILKGILKKLKKITKESVNEENNQRKRVLILGKFVAESRNNPLDMSNTKIILYEESIRSVAYKYNIRFDSLLRIVFAHELFHAYHSYHYSLKHKKQYPYVKYKDKVVSESLAAYIEYLYSSEYLVYDGFEWCEHRVNEWKEMDASWYPYSGALVLKHNMIDDEDSWASKVFHDSIDGMDEKTRTKVGKIIIDAYHLEKELYKF